MDMYVIAGSEINCTAFTDDGALVVEPIDPIFPVELRYVVIVDEMAHEYHYVTMSRNKHKVSWN